jgi:hypothetical protein
MGGKRFPVPIEGLLLESKPGRAVDLFPGKPDFARGQTDWAEERTWMSAPGERMKAS